MPASAYLHSLLIIIFLGGCQTTRQESAPRSSLGADEGSYCRAKGINNLRADGGKVNEDNLIGVVYGAVQTAFPEQ